MDIDSFSTEFEGRRYIDPNITLQENANFIDNLRAVQQNNNQEIRQDTYNLGTAVPSNLGGLVGGEGYFTSRYQTPQTVALTNELRAVAQANALNQALQNEQAKWKQRYNRAYQAAKRRANPTTPTTPTTVPELPVDTITDDGTGKVNLGKKPGPGDMGVYYDGKSYSTYYVNPDNRSVLWVGELGAADIASGVANGLNKYSHGQIINRNGNKYLYNGNTNQVYKVVSESSFFDEPSKFLWKGPQ